MTRLWCAGSLASTPTQRVSLKMFVSAITSSRGSFWSAGGIPTVGVFGPGTGPIFLKNVGCFGTENNLLECFSSGVAFVTDCDHSQDVEVVCSGKLL